GDADGKHNAVQAVDVDAQRADHLAVAGAGTYHHAQAGAPKHPVQQYCDQQADGGNEQAVDRISHDLAQRNGAGQPVWSGHAMHVVAHGQTTQFFKDQNQAVGHEHLLQMIAAIQETEESPFQEITQNGGQQQTAQDGDE